MKARVFYVHLTNAQTRIINHTDSGGWDSELGREYMLARDGQSPNSYLYQLAAEVEAPEGYPEVVWSGMQNVLQPWIETPNNPNLTVLSVHTDFPRSMDVGDKIVWENGRVDVVASMGFKTMEMEN